MKFSMTPNSQRLHTVAVLAALSLAGSSHAAVLSLNGPWSQGTSSTEWVREVLPGLFAVASLTGNIGSAQPVFGNDGTFVVTGDPARDPAITYTLSLQRMGDSGTLVGLLPGEFSSVRIESGDIDSSLGSHITDVWGMVMPPTATASFPATLTQEQRFASLSEYSQFSLRQDLWASNLLGEGPIGSDGQKDFTVTIDLPTFESGQFLFGMTTPAGVPEGGALKERGFLLRISGDFTPIPEPSVPFLAATAVGTLMARRRRS
jgi:hypothetical protein